MVTPVPPTIDPATAMCCGGAIIITVILVVSIVAIIFFYGIAAWVSWRIFKALGIEFKKKK